MQRGVPGSTVGRKATTASPARPWSRLALAGFLLAIGFSPLTADLTRAASDPPAPGAPATSQTHEWLVDDRGREYRIERIDKKQPHQIMGNRVRLTYGITMDLAGQDENFLLVKVYRDTGPEPVQQSMPKGMSLEEKARIAATYETELRTSQTMAFEPFDEGLPRRGQWRAGFALADMNGDGHVDIVHGPPRRSPGAPLVFLGDGAGRWRRWQTSFPPQRYDYGQVVVADFNRDGHLDLALGMHLLGITVVLGDSAGRFRSASQGMDPLSPQTAFSSHALVAVDWDGDGHLDLVALGEGPRMGARRTGADISTSSGLVLYRNQGDAVWQKKASPLPLAGDALVLAQSRSNGQPWLVAGSITQGQKNLLIRPGDPFAVEALPGVRPGSTVRAIALADFDGDGQEDIAIAYNAYEGEQWRSGIDVVLRQADGSTQRRTVYVQTGPQGVTALGAGDLDGDGWPDLVALSGNGETVVLKNAGNGAFTREDVQLTERILGCRGYHVKVQDLDKDGRADIVAAFAGEREGFGSLESQGCPGEGSLRAWRSRPRP